MASEELLQKHALSLLQELLPQEAWTSQDMVDTAGRWCRMMKEMSRTSELDFKFTTFENPGYDEMVLLDNIHYSSLCSHHLLPFFGVMHIAYIPDKKIVGLSKIPRLVRHVAKGTWTQEGLTASIADFMEEHLDPVGVAVIVPKSTHTCMSVRGVQDRCATTTTSTMKGAFADHARLARAELFSLLSL